MQTPPIPADEAARVAALRALDILDSAPEQAYDDLVAIASAICGTPMGAVTLIDSDRQWFKAKRGIDLDGTPRDLAFCAHAIVAPDDVMLVPDTRDDPRVSGNPFATGENAIRFYAGVPLVTNDGHAVGAFCVMDNAPRVLDEAQVSALRALARQASALLELRRVGRALGLQLRERQWYEQRMRDYQQALEDRNADLEAQTRTDPLTGLANRRAFAVQLDEAVAAARTAGTPLHVAVADIDHFKSINDLLGHAEGDRVLAAVAQVLRSGADGARVARYGGEEFVLLLAGMPADGAQLQCEYLREAVAAMPGAMPVTISIGLATLSAGEDGAALVERADAALYAAKRGGRDRVVVG